VSAIGTLETASANPGFLKDEPLYEIVNGQKVELPFMGVFANLIAFRLARILVSFVEPRMLGTILVETLFILDSINDIRRRPDVAFLTPGRWPLDREVPEAGDLDAIPNLAIEVVSPNDGFQEVFKKMEEYFRLSVNQVWLVIPSQRQIYVYDSPAAPRVFSVDEEFDGGTLLPGLRFPVASVFRRTSKVEPIE
jgi:Uma2 family endonuclease